MESMRNDGHLRRASGEVKLTGGFLSRALCKTHVTNSERVVETGVIWEEKEGEGISYLRCGAFSFHALAA